MSVANRTEWESIRAATEQLSAAVAEAGGPDKADWQKIAHAAQKIHEAAKDPANAGMEGICQISLITANRILWEWGVFDEIPLEGSISYSELATKVDADVSLLSESTMVSGYCF